MTAGDFEQEDGKGCSVGVVGEGKLNRVLKEACSELGYSRNDLTVLSVQRDPYRRDTGAGHRDGAWFAAQADRFVPAHKTIHIRGLHYAVSSAANVLKPDGTLYRNDDKDWEWFQEAAQDARWLGYLPFERLADAKNSEPIVRPYADPPGEPHVSVYAGSVALIEEWKPDARVEGVGLWASAGGISAEQPFRLVLFGEKTSLADVLDPLAASYSADLYLASGEISDTLIHRMAKDGAADGRPLVVFTVSDFDPSGWQMPISIGRKLQALKDLLFPDLDFAVIPVALNDEQVRELGLPSTPLKEMERRADRWREAHGGLEQTEIDAAIQLRPDHLRRYITAALDCYYDHGLRNRVLAAQRAWQAAANAALRAQTDDAPLADMKRRAEEWLAGLKRRAEDANTEVLRVNEELERINYELWAVRRGIDLQVQPPELPEPDMAALKDAQDSARQGVLIDSRWGWVRATQALKARRDYRPAPTRKMPGGPAKDPAS